jgi:hypothetical protein
MPLLLFVPFYVEANVNLSNGLPHEKHVDIVGVTGSIPVTPTIRTHGNRYAFCLLAAGETYFP